MAGITPLSILILFGAIQGLILAVAINRIRDRNRPANRILAVFILLISLVLFSRLVYAESISIWRTYPHLFLLPDIPLLLYGPIFYFYIRTLLSRPVEGFSRWWLHFLPAAGHFLLMALYLLESREVYFRRLMTLDLWEVPYISFIALLQMAIYLWISYRLLAEHRRALPNHASFQENFRYLQTFFALAALSWFSWLYVTMYPYLPFLPNLSFLNYNFSWVCLSFTTFILAYFAMTRQEIFKLPPEEQRRKYENSSLSEEMLINLQQRLEKLMAAEKPYLDSKLTLSHLAELMAIHPRDLSRLINEKFAMNFFDFINSYRVAEFKMLAVEDRNENITLLAIAFEAGFNSKTAFNTAFKKLTHQTPMAYMKSREKRMSG